MTAFTREERACLWTAAALLALLGLTVGLSFMDLGRYGFIASLAVAAAKALLVAYVFMEVGRGVDAVRLMASAGLVWLALLLGGAIADLATRR